MYSLHIAPARICDLFLGRCHVHHGILVAASYDVCPKMGILQRQSPFRSCIRRIHVRSYDRILVLLKSNASRELDKAVVVSGAACTVNVSTEPARHSDM